MTTRRRAARFDHDEKIIFAATALVIAVAAQAQEKDTKPHDNAITFGVGLSSADVAVRHIFRDRWAVLGRVGYGSQGPAIASSGSVDSYDLGVAVRRMFGTKPFRPFAHLEAIRRWSRFGCNHTATMSYVGGGGVEYFVAPRVSVEGLAGAEHDSVQGHCDDNTFHAHQTITLSSGVFVSFYF
jgi:hypothetical protein